MSDITLTAPFAEIDKEAEEAAERFRHGAHLIPKDTWYQRGYTAAALKYSEGANKKIGAVADAANRQCLELRLTEAARDAALQVAREVAAERDHLRAALEKQPCQCFDSGMASRTMICSRCAALKKE
jgi:hypothetical protein